MWVWMFLVVVALVVPAPAQAVYTDAVVVSNDVQVDGRTLIVLRIRGDAQEPDVQLKYSVPANPSMSELRYTIGERMAELNLARAVAAAPAVSPGAVVAPLARPAPPALTAKQIWQGKAQRLDRYLEFQAKGVTAINAATTALLADINATYVAGHAD